MIEICFYIVSAINYTAWIFGRFKTSAFKDRLMRIYIFVSFVNFLSKLRKMDLFSKESGNQIVCCD